MSTPIAIVRISSYCLICVLALGSLAFAQSLVRSKTATTQAYGLAGFTIALSILTLMGILTFLVASRHGHQVEVTLLSLFWVFWLSIGAAGMAIRNQLFTESCSIIPGKTPAGHASTYCHELGALGALVLSIWMICMCVSIYCCIT